MGCNFGSQLGSDKASSLEALLAYYNYATSSGISCRCLDSDEADKTFFEKPKAGILGLARPEHRTMVGKRSEFLNAVGGVQHTAGRCLFLYCHRYRWRITHAARSRSWSSKQINQSRVSLTSSNRQFNGMDTIGSTAIRTLSSRSRAGERGSYRYSASCTVPELFATVINPDLKNAATGV